MIQVLHIFEVFHLSWRMRPDTFNTFITCTSMHLKTSSNLTLLTPVYSPSGGSRLYGLQRSRGSRKAGFVPRLVRRVIREVPRWGMTMREMVELCGAALAVPPRAVALVAVGVRSGSRIGIKRLFTTQIRPTASETHSEYIRTTTRCRRITRGTVSIPNL